MELTEARLDAGDEIRRPLRGRGRGRGRVRVRFRVRVRVRVTLQG